MREAHDGVVGGHYIGKETVCKILHVELWWPTIHMDTKIFYRHCDIFQRTEQPSHCDKMPLTLHITLQAFDKWKVYFVGLISPPGKRTSTRYIITVTDYLTKWA